MSDNTEIVPVVAAVIRNLKGQYLIGKRASGVWMPGKWCFIGGKVEKDEELPTAIYREVREEIGIPVTVCEMIHEQLVKYDHGLFHLHFFDCVMNDIEPQPDPNEISVTVFAWPKDLLSYDLLPVDIDIAKALALEAIIRENHERIADLETTVGILRKQLTIVQTECTKLLLEKRELQEKARASSFSGA